MVLITQAAGTILFIFGIIYIFLKALGKFQASSKESEEGEIESKWFTLKGNTGLILVGLGVLLFLFGPLVEKPTATPPFPPTPGATLTPTMTPTPTSTPIISFTDCFQGIPENRIKVMEEGTQDFELTGPLESKDEPVVIKLTKNNELIGYIKLIFISTNEIFKIEKIVDPKCQQIEEYSNIDRGGDKHVLQNWDTVQIRFGDYKYGLRIGYTGVIIEAAFTRTV